MTIADGDLPDIAESLIGRGNMTADERAAVDGLRREGQVAAGSPFKPGIAGDSVHAEMIDARLAELLQPVERRPYRAIIPQGTAETARLDLMRSEEHPSELQSLMRISYAVFCLKKKKKNIQKTEHPHN